MRVSGRPCLTPALDRMPEISPFGVTEVAPIYAFIIRDTMSAGTPLCRIVGFVVVRGTLPKAFLISSHVR